MFKRGQRFIITESTAKTRQHPAIGDCGYLRNVMLCHDKVLGIKFVVADAFFSKFSKDKEGRCEKKRFILSNLLTDLTKSLLRAGVDHKNLVFVHTLILDNVLSHVSKGNPFTICNYDNLFITMAEKNGNSRELKAPICKIEALGPIEIHKNKYERKAWIRSVRPTIADVAVILGDEKVNLPPELRSTMKDVCNYFHRCTDRKKGKGFVLAGTESNIQSSIFGIIMGINKIQALVASLIFSREKNSVFRQLLFIKKMSNDHNAALDRCVEFLKTK